MTDYTPSPELVEAAHDDALFVAERDGDWMKAAILAAVAYRTPSGDPELVPWVEVAALIEAARAMADWQAGYWGSVSPDLAAALAPWTQENR